MVANIGIKAIEIYFPKLYVEQSELEQHDGVAVGKYTIGLGQKQMAFCADLEDVNTLALTVLNQLIVSYEIDLNTVGRLEVGTESSVDKSKSVKSTLMRLFEERGMTDIEGCDCVNACYGGTQALLNAVNWCESSAARGGNAIVVMCDIAIYERGPARCTGGAAAVAVLIGADAPLVFEPGARVFSMHDTHDFFKPLTRRAGLYPVVQGADSLYNYTRCAEDCYRKFKQRFPMKNGKQRQLSNYRHVFMHSPYTKLVRKTFALLDLVDKESNKSIKNGLLYDSSHNLTTPYINNVAMQKEAIANTVDLFERLVQPTLTFASSCGNVYTSSLIAGLMSALATNELTDDNTLLFYSYGSGACSSIFLINVDLTSERQRRAYEQIASIARLSVARLDARTKISPDHYTDLVAQRENVNAEWRPCNKPTDELLFDATYYLTNIDVNHIRSYDIYKPYRAV